MTSNTSVRAGEDLLNASLKKVEALLTATYTDHPIESHVNAMCACTLSAQAAKECVLVWYC